MRYRFSEVEEKWQKYWQDNKTFQSHENYSKPKFYVLDMFPYPSGSGLHVGHIEGYTATDIISRYKRLQGFNVMHPIGWDAFGLPAEQHAVRTGTHPVISTKKNTDRFRRTLKKLGFSYDWSREIDTTDPSYYKWTQWIFSKLFEYDLAYITEMPVNWCVDLKTVLADEEVEEHVEKGYAVVQKPLKQWVLRITRYADRLLRDLDLVDWPESLKEMQRNWIGRSEGIEIDFPIENREDSIKIFTTRPDTIFGVTYLVMSPEHSLVSSLIGESQKIDVEQYKQQATRKNLLERSALQQDKTGLFTGSYAINPANNKRIPIWISDFVLSTYGTGAIMAVPAHDKRDWEFAKKYELPIIQVITHAGKSENMLKEALISKDGVCINSKSAEVSLDGLSFKDAFHKMMKWTEAKGIGCFKITYKLRDWVFSRQRYWGEPIPIKKYENGKLALDSDLPLLLPSIASFHPSESGESPLANAPKSWLYGEDVDGIYRRETNTMPQWAGSCWYYLRYLDPQNERKVVDPQKEKYWMNVDLYIGGTEHAVLHLLYARFWHKFLFDLKIVSTVEPFQKIVNQGMILGEDGMKMSKSRGNVVSADLVLQKYGGDAIRLYEMFMGPLDRVKPWSMDSIEGLTRFLNKIWGLFYDKYTGKVFTMTYGSLSKELAQLLHQTIKKVGDDIEAMKFNTAIAQLMILVNKLQKESSKNKHALESLLIMLSLFAPHIAEALWEAIGNTPSISTATFPLYDPKFLKNDEVVVTVQVNGKKRGTFKARPGQEKGVLLLHAKQANGIAKFIQGKEIVKEIIVPDKIVNIVVKP